MCGHLPSESLILCFCFRFQTDSRMAGCVQKELPMLSVLTRKLKIHIRKKSLKQPCDKLNQKNIYHRKTTQLKMQHQTKKTMQTRQLY